MAKQKNAQPASTMVRVQLAETKPKMLRSDHQPRRVTYDKVTGRIITEDHHTVIAGAIDRGLSSSPFEVVSISKRTGEIIRTRHKDLITAVKARKDRKAHHHSIQVIYHTPVEKPAQAIAEAA